MLAPQSAPHVASVQPAHAKARAKRPELLLRPFELIGKSQQHRLCAIAVLVFIRHGLFSPIVHFHDMLTCFLCKIHFFPL